MKSVLLMSLLALSFSAFSSEELFLGNELIIPTDSGAKLLHFAADGDYRRSSEVANLKADCKAANKILAAHAKLPELEGNILVDPFLSYSVGPVIDNGYGGQYIPDSTLASCQVSLKDVAGFEVVYVGKKLRKAATKLANKLYADPSVVAVVLDTESNWTITIPKIYVVYKK